MDILVCKMKQDTELSKKIRRVYVNVDIIATRKIIERYEVWKIYNLNIYQSRYDYQLNSNRFYDDIHYSKYQYTNVVVCLCQSLLLVIKDQQDIPMKSKWHWRGFIVFYNLVENRGSKAIDLFTLWSQSIVK